MSIGVAEIDARTARGPGKAALDGNAPFSKASPPRWQTPGGNAEANVRWAACAMRWNCSEGQGCTLRVGAANKEKQHLPPADAESTEAVVRLHDRVTEKAGVELARTGQICHVEASLQNCARERSVALRHWSAQDLPPKTKMRRMFIVISNSNAPRTRIFCQQN